MRRSRRNGLAKALKDVGLYRARAGERTIPHDVVDSIHNGVHPVRAWRKHRGLTLQRLATMSKTPVGYLSEIDLPVMP